LIIAPRDATKPQLVFGSGDEMGVWSGGSDRAFGAEVLQNRAQQLLGQVSSLKRRIGGESVHDTRVASRRLRAALEAFEDLFPPERWKAGYSSARAVTKALGRVREEEVTLGLLAGLTNGGDLAENLCREYLEERYRKEIARLQAKMMRRLGRINMRHLRAQIDTLLQGFGPPGAPTEAGQEEPAGAAPATASRRRDSHQGNLFDRPGGPLVRARRVAESLCAPILSFRPRYDFRRASDERLHNLRIAGKKLRYALEIFDPVWPGGLASEIALSRALQDTAGEYHDWVVLRERLQAEIRRLTRKETTHLAFQIGRILALVEDRKSEKRKAILPALTGLQTGLLEALARARGEAAGARSADMAVAGSQ